MKPIRLLLVDDHEMVRAGLRALLSRVADIEVAGEAGSVAAAVREAGRLQPDLVLMDLRLPDGSGVDACREILSAARQPIRVVFLTSYSDEEAVMSTVLSGASGYLLKEIGQRALIEAIRDAVAGRAILSPGVTQPALGKLRAALSDERSPRDPVDSLSAQERRVLALVVEGKTNKEIATALDLSDKTVKNYLANIFQKLHITRRAQAAALFVKRQA